MQVAPLLLLVSQTLLQPAQFAVVFVGVSHPPVSGAVTTQLAQPDEHDGELRRVQQRLRHDQQQWGDVQRDDLPLHELQVRVRRLQPDGAGHERV